MKHTISNTNSFPHREKNYNEEMGQFLVNNKEHVFELISLVKHLQEYNLLTFANESIAKHSNRLQGINGKTMDQLINGIKRGIEEGSSNMDTGKDINAFQLMKYLKDPDINRAVNYLVHFLRGMGKSLN